MENVLLTKTTRLNASVTPTGLVPIVILMLTSAPRELTSALLQRTVSTTTAVSNAAAALATLVTASPARISTSVRLELTSALRTPSV